MHQPRRLPKMRGVTLAALVVVFALGSPSTAAAADPVCTLADHATGLGTFTDATLPSGCWRPYGNASPFNQALPDNPKSAANSAAIVKRVVGFGNPDNLVAGNAGTADDYSHPTYYSRPTDPVYRLHCYEASWGRCAIEDHELRVPDKAKPAAGGDGHLTVVDQASGWEYDLYKVRSKPAGGGTLEFRWGGRTRIEGDGLGSGGTAAGVGNLAGIIRAQELERGRIDHAVFMVVRCDSGQKVYPATGQGRACDKIGLPNADAPPMGARFQLAMSSAEINALPVPAWKKTILRAMARYGAYFSDTGSGAWALQMESGSTYTSFGREDGMVSFARNAGVAPYNGKYVFNLRDGVDWAKYLRVIDPCVTQATCTSEVAPPPPPPSPSSDPPPEVSPSVGPVSPQEEPAAPVRIHVSLSARGKRTVTARGSVAGQARGVVQLTTLYAEKGKSFKPVSKRRTALSNGRFQAEVGRYRRGRWQVKAVLRGAEQPAVDARNQRLDSEGGTAVPPVVDDGRRGLSAEEEGTTTGEAEATAVQESQLGTLPEPGPLATGGYIGRGVGSPAAIRSVQKMLSNAGHRTQVDGEFGPLTDAAVRRFQRTEELLVDGLVGRQTMSALKEDSGGR